jgi:hypothetical protein
VWGPQAAYIRVPQSARTALQAQGLPFRDGLHAASHALVNVLPLFLLCNASDLGTECDNPYDTRFRPERLLVYDKHPGGIGLAKQVRVPAWMLSSSQIDKPAQHKPLASLDFITLWPSLHAPTPGVALAVVNRQDPHQQGTGNGSFYSSLSSDHVMGRGAGAAAVPTAAAAGAGADPRL